MKRYQLTLNSDKTGPFDALVDARSAKEAAALGVQTYTLLTGERLEVLHWTRCAEDRLTNGELDSLGPL